MAAEATKVQNLTQDVHTTLAQLRIKLLDLTLRNRLLNFRPTIGKSLQFVQGDAEAIYKFFQADTSNRRGVRIIGLPEPARSDFLEKAGRMVRPDPRDWALKQGIPASFDLDPTVRTHLEQGSIRALMYADDLARHCRKLEREASTAIQETGSNMFYLVLAFLEFPETSGGEKLIAAPLVAVPVALERSQSATGTQLFSINYTGEDITENLSLREKLKVEHSLNLPLFPDEDFDLTDYLKQVKTAVNGRQGFQIRNRITLSMLSFANMLLVKDLDPENWKTEQQNLLFDHPIVSQILGASAPEDAGSDAGYAVEGEPADSLPLVFDADSSQTRALLEAVSGGRNMVIEGPPGTGKSQTISNIIAACLAAGKTVLFVAEKLAALEVVKSRLAIAGLDNFVLELHGNKGNKKRVVEELAKRRAMNVEALGDLNQELEQLYGYRTELVRYVSDINRVGFNAQRKSIHQAIWGAKRYAEALGDQRKTVAALELKDFSELSQVELGRRIDTIKLMGQLHGEIDTYGPAGPFWGFFPKVLTPDDVEAVLGVLKEAKRWANDLEDDVRDLCEQLHAQIDAFTLGVITRQNVPVGTYLDSLSRDIPLDLFTTVCANDQKLRAEVSSILDGIELVQKDGAEGKRRRSLGLSNFEGVGAEDLQTVTELLETIRSYGLGISKFTQAKDLCAGIAALRICLEDLQDDLSDLLADRSIKGDRVAGQLDNVIELATLIQEAPTNIDQKFFSIEWTQDGFSRLQTLKQDLDRHRTLADELRPKLRFDYLPSRESLIESMLVFREGDAWFRIFQARWRKANAMHKSIGLRQNLTAAERLRDFEQLVQWIDLDLSVRSNPDWSTILGFSVPDLSFNLDLPLIVATWSLKSGNVFSNVPGLTNSIHEISRTDLIRIKRDYVKIKSIVENASQVLDFAPKFGIRLSNYFSDERPVLDSISSLIEFCKNAQKALDQLLSWGATRVSPRAKLPEVVDAIKACIELQVMERSLASNQRIGALLGSVYKGLETDIGSIRKLYNIEKSINDMEVMKVVMAFICGGNPKARFTQLDQLVTQINRAFAKVGAFEQSMLKFGEFNLEVWAGFSKNSDIVDFSSWFASRVETASGQSSIALSNWAHYLGQRNAAIDLGLEPLCIAMEVGSLKAEMLPDAIRYSYYASVVRRAFSAVPNLSQFKGTTHESRIKRYRELDRQIIRTRGKRIAFEARRRSAPPAGISAARASQLTEMALVNHLIDHPRARVTIRSLMGRATKAIRALKPCFMMGPQAVSQYLAPGQIKFDVVVMDEASQLKPEEAIGAIARAKQLIVVGDPKQLPPTSFFSKNSISDDEDDQYVAVEAESILDVCKQKFASCRQLQFHYRSQHHSLIAFSNRHFYDESLIVTPAPFEAGDGLGVKAIYLPTAVYEGQLNVQEANAVVRSAIQQINEYPEKSLLVVTLNIKQSDYIAELFEQQVQGDKRISEYRQKWEEAGEPLEFKNLENVQGEERDVVMISTTFGKSPGAEKPRQNFGPISRQGGWRRLNVLFTRARQELKLFTSLDPEDIVVGPDSPQGTIALRNYLQFVKTGHETIPENSGALPDSDFEYYVIRRLQAIGYSVVPQLGVGKYRIDIAVVHPDIAGAYLAAIECDGESYHSAESARDRDRIRQEVLESLGWKGRIWRIWSTDWFRDADAEFSRLETFLKQLREQWRPSFVKANHWLAYRADESTRSSIPVEKNESEVNTSTVARENADSKVKHSTSLKQEAASVSASAAHQSEVIEKDVRDEPEIVLVGEVDIEVGIGTIIRYVEQTLTGTVEGTLKIVAGTDHPELGILSTARPLAQCFLGAVKGDEVMFYAGHAARKFTIIDVRRM